MSEERRQSIRVQTRLTIIIKNLDTKRVWRTLTNDISSLGVCVVMEEFWEPGVKLEFTIKLPDRDAPVTCMAEVVWSRFVRAPQKSYESSIRAVGMKFTKIQSKDEALLKQYLAMNPSPPQSAGDR